MKKNKQVKAMIQECIGNDFLFVWWRDIEDYKLEYSYGIVSIDGNGHPIAVCKG